MRRNLTSVSTDRTFPFSWLPQSEKYASVFLITFEPSGKKNSMYPPPLPNPRNFRDRPWGEGEG